MSKTLLIVIGAAAIVALLAMGAWALGLFSGASAVTGTVTYDVRSALPPDAILTVAIQDVSLADAPATTLGQQIINNPGQVPIAYEVGYDSAEIIDNHTYAIAARIEDSQGNLLFINDTVIPVITNGNPTQDVEAKLIPVSSSPASVSGTVTYMVRSALPPDAVTTVRIEDVSKADAPAITMGEIRIDGGQVPLAYEVAYDPAAIIDNHTYVVSARIEDSQGNLLFINDTSIPVITRGSPTKDVEIMTIPVGPPDTTATMTGNVTYLVRSALPPDAVTTVQLLDVSLADAPATVIGEQKIVGGQVPIPYELNYDSSQIQQNHRYTLFARITDGQGNLLFISDTNIPALTNGAPTDGIESQLVPVGDSSGGTGNTVSGTVTYLQRIALPDDAVLTVEILDVSLADAVASVIGRTVIPNPGQVPIAYDVIFDPTVIQQNHTYSMHAKIIDGQGNLIFVSDTSTPVITNGNPTQNVEVVVVPVVVDMPATVGAITGTVTYLQRIELPPNTLLTITVQDVSRMDAPGLVIGSITMSNPGQPPIPYEVRYDATQVVDNHDYAIAARLTDVEGNLLFISDTRIPVITKGNPTEDVEILVVPVAAQ